MQLSDLKSSETMTTNETSIVPIQGAIQHYDWGGLQFIPELLGVENTAQQPFAELWMGTHLRGPARAQIQNTSLPLGDLIQQNPEKWLGKRVAHKFDNQLPFLFKVLDVNKMLSIQSHPTKEKAVAGYLAENQKGIPLTAFNRVFKDDNHKPEIMVALTDFWLLHGFKSVAAIAQTLEEVPEFSSLKGLFGQENIFDLYKTIMEWPQATINEILAPLGNRLSGRYKAGELTPDQADYWAALAFQRSMESENQIDRGIFSIYLFNLVELKPGQGIFQDAGIPHAYLRGVNMELMANSDNVFRGGLTKKFIAVPELLENLVFDPVTPNILEGSSISPVESVFQSPSPDFELRKIQLDPSQEQIVEAEDSPAIIILLAGKASVGPNLELSKGQICFVPAGTKYQIKAQEKALLFKAMVP